MGKVPLESHLVHTLFKCTLCNGLIRSATAIDECLHRCERMTMMRSGKITTRHLGIFSLQNLYHQTFRKWQRKQMSNVSGNCRPSIGIIEVGRLTTIGSWSQMIHCHRFLLDRIPLFNAYSTNFSHLCFNVRVIADDDRHRNFIVSFILGEINYKPSLLSAAIANGNQLLLAFASLKDIFLSLRIAENSF